MFCRGSVLWRLTEEGLAQVQAHHHLLLHHHPAAAAVGALPVVGVHGVAVGVLPVVGVLGVALINLEVKHLFELEFGIK